MKRLIWVVVLTVLAGCATVEGLGRDISGGANTVNNWIN
jgi:predicted small secreted protein